MRVLARRVDDVHRNVDIVEANIFVILGRQLRGRLFDHCLNRRQHLVVPDDILQVPLLMTPETM